MPTKNLSGIEEIEARAGVERGEPGGRAELGAGGALPAGPLLPGLPGGGGLERPELSDELIDELNRARVRTAVGELPGGGRLSDAVIDELLAGASSEEEIVGPGGLLAQLTKRLVERALEVELTDHLGYEHGQAPPGGTGNARNGTTRKTLVTEHGQVPIDAPRDRKGTF